jgi:hypothetical protein
MTTRLMTVALACVLGGSLPAASAQECSGVITADEAGRAEDARYAAQTTNDFAAMGRLFGDDLVYIHSSGVVDDKASFLELMRSGTTRYRAIKRRDVKVRTYGCLAIITGTADVDLTARGQDQTLQLRFLSAWVKRPAGIQFVSWNSTRIAPPPPPQ